MTIGFWLQLKNQPSGFTATNPVNIPGGPERDAFFILNIQNFETTLCNQYPSNLKSGIFQTMKTIKNTILIILSLFACLNCQKNVVVKDYSALLDSISSQKYYSAEILNNNHIAINGTWKLIGTSGGFAGSGYSPDFNYLIIKPNGIFGVVRNGSLITMGKILIKSQSDNELIVDLISEVSPTQVPIEIIQDPEKYFELHNDTLNLIAPCCDRFNTQFKRVK